MAYILNLKHFVENMTIYACVIVQLRLSSRKMTSGLKGKQICVNLSKDRNHSSLWDSVHLHLSEKSFHKVMFKRALWSGFWDV